jgi:hypothetical protein
MIHDKDSLINCYLRSNNGIHELRKHIFFCFFASIDLLSYMYKLFSPTMHILLIYHFVLKLYFHDTLRLSMSS